MNYCFSIFFLFTRLLFPICDFPVSPLSTSSHPANRFPRNGMKGAPCSYIEHYFKRRNQQSHENTKMYINGEWVGALKNAYTGLSRVPSGKRADTKRSIDAAEQALSNMVTYVAG